MYVCTRFKGKHYLYLANNFCKAIQINYTQNQNPAQHQDNITKRRLSKKAKLAIIEIAILVLIELSGVVLFNAHSKSKPTSPTLLNAQEIAFQQDEILNKVCKRPLNTPYEFIL